MNGIVFGTEYIKYLSKRFSLNYISGELLMIVKMKLLLLIMPLARVLMHQYGLLPPAFNSV